MNRNLFLLIVVACAGFGLLDASSAAAQAVQKDSAAAIVKLSAEQLKAFEGYFQSSQNKDMVVQFSAVENGLFARLLWNNGEVHLTPESATGFVSKEAGDGGPIHIVFQKDPTGVVNQVNVADNGVWNRIKDYKPVVKKEMEHTPAQLAPFQGLYQLQGGDAKFPKFIKFSERENKLVLKQSWDGNEIMFVPESELAFFSREIKQFTLDFSKDNNGNITQVLAFKHDVWVKAKKPALTPAILASYQGKYQSEADPDNQIRIIARDSNLVIKQLWDGKETVVMPLGDTYFNNATLSLPLLIVMGPDGKPSQVVLMETNTFKKVAD
jgi:adenylate kinase family enzyme